MVIYTVTKHIMCLLPTIFSLQDLSRILCKDPKRHASYLLGSVLIALHVTTPASRKIKHLST